MKHVITATIALLGAAGPTVAQFASDTVVACQESPTADCLADIGYASALATENFKNSSGILFAEMGRVEDAWDVIFHSAVMGRRNQQEAEEYADDRVIEYRLIERLAAGDDFQTAIELYGADEAAVQSTTSRLVGASRMGPGFVRETDFGPGQRTLIKRIALETPRSIIPAIKAAYMLTYIGETEAAKAIVADLADEDIPVRFYSEAMLQAIGLERVLRIFESRDDVARYYYEPIFRIDTDTERLEGLMRKFVADVEKLDDPVDRFDRLALLAQFAHRHGLIQFAEDLAKEMKLELETNASKYSETYALLVYADVLARIETGQTELIRDILSSEERRIDDAPTRILRNSLRQTVGETYVRLQDTEAAFRVLAETEVVGRNGLSLWQDSLLFAKSGELRDRLVVALASDIPDEEWNFILADIAAKLFVMHSTDSDKAWAYKTARDLVEKEAKLKEPSLLGSFYNDILTVATRSGDAHLMKRALEQSASRSLESGDPNSIIRAAWQYHNLEEK